MTMLSSVIDPDLRNCLGHARSLSRSNCKHVTHWDRHAMFYSRGSGSVWVKIRMMFFTQQTRWFQKLPGMWLQWSSNLTHTHCMNECPPKNRSTTWTISESHRIDEFRVSGDSKHRNLNLGLFAKLSRPQCWHFQQGKWMRFWGTLKVITNDETPEPRDSHR